MKVLSLVLILLLSPLSLLADTLPVASGQALTGASAVISLEGVSTLHKFHSKSTRCEISGSLNKARGKSLFEAVKAGALSALTLTLPVEGMKSGEDGLDQNMYKAMHSADHPLIRFNMKNYTTKDSQVLTWGSLEINGIAKGVSLGGSLSDLSGTVEVKGSYDLLMSDYQVKAPVLMFGTIRCDDKVSIAYDFELISKP